MERWTDVGPLLQAARADMKVGQLLACEAFSLFEAMSALEAGNPKMDAAASPTVERPTLESILADPAAAPWELSTPTLLEVLDQLLAMEASWHCGASAMQSVYACLYMLKLNRAQEYTTPAARALYAYCRTLQYDCATVRDLILSGGVCEEEDINIFTAGIPFEPPAVGADAALAALDAAIAQANGQPTTAAATENGNGNASTVDAEGPLGPEVAWRLQLRREIHAGLRKATSWDPKAVCDSAAHFSVARQLLTRIRGSSGGLAATLTTTATTTGTATASSAAAAAAPAGEAAAAKAEEPALAPGFQIDVNRHLLGPAPPRQVQVKSFGEALSYTERLMEHLQVAAAIPEHVFDYRSLQVYLWRFARMQPGSVARSLMHSLIIAERWQTASSGAATASSSQQQQQQDQPQQPTGSSSNSSSNTASGADRPVGRNSSSAGSKGKGAGRKPQHQKQQGAAASASSSASSTSGTGAASSGAATPWVPSKEMIAGACQLPYKAGLPEEVELFFDQATIAVGNVCQAILMNRCRSRRRLRRCLEDWINMFHHAVNADEAPGLREAIRAAGWRWRPMGQVPEEEQGPLGLWVEYQTAATMLHHLLAGFQLELYEAKEYDMIFWYADYLCTCMINNFTAVVQRCPLPQPPKLPSPQQQPSGGAGRGLGRGLGRGRGGAAAVDPEAAKRAAAAAMARYEKEQHLLRYEILEVEALQQLCQGMLRMMAGLKLAGAVSEPREALPFNSGAQRFEQRFAAFGELLRPPPLSYGDYLTSMDPGGRQAPFLLTLAATSFKEARSRCAPLKASAPYPDLAEGWVRGLERAAGTNAVVSGVMAHKLKEEGAQVKWDCDWSHHAYFPAISLPKTAAAAATPASP